MAAFELPFAFTLRNFHWKDARGGAVVYDSSVRIFYVRNALSRRGSRWCGILFAG